MKKRFHILIPALILAAALSLTACGGEPAPDGTETAPAAVTSTPVPTLPPVVMPTDFDWTTYKEWQETDWDKKDAAYQLSGSYAVSDPDFDFRFLLNLYENGSAAAEQLDVLTGEYSRIYGYWGENGAGSGNVIQLNTLYAGEPDGTLVPFEYEYTLPADGSGVYAFDLTFGILPGQFLREAPLSGGAVEYAGFAAFRAAQGCPAEALRFESTEPSAEGVACAISVLPDGSAVCRISTVYEEETVVLDETEGMLLAETTEGKTIETLVIGEAEIPLETDAGGRYEAFEFTYRWAYPDGEIDCGFTMKQVR